MKASEIQGVWIVEDGPDTIKFWIEADGIHSERKTVNGIHSEQVLPFQDAVDKAEGQLRL